MSYADDVLILSDAVRSPAAGTHRSDSLRLDAGMSAAGIPRLKAGEDVKGRAND